MVVLVIDLISLLTIFTETRFSRKFDLLASPNDLNVHIFSDFTNSYLYILTLGKNLKTLDQTKRSMPLCIQLYA